MKKIKRYLDLFWAHKACVRKFIGGKWVRRKRDLNCAGEWVTWNEPENLELSGWPLDPDEYVCEEYL